MSEPEAQEYYSVERSEGHIHTVFLSLSKHL